MTNPDYRAMCAELINELSGYKVANPMHDRSLLNRARALLAEPVAEGPTIPSRYRGHEIAVYRDGFHAGYKKALATAAEPVAESEAEGPTDEELREMWFGSEWFNEGATLREFISTSRAVLARWGRPAAAPVPKSGEVAQVAIELQELAESCDTIAMGRVHRLLTRAAALLQQQAAPVPVSERPWERQGWCDKDGRCWFGWADEPDASWSFCKPSERDIATVSLPANALPLPAEVKS